MLKSLPLNILYGSSLVFTVLNLVFLAQGYYWFSAVPVSLGIMLLFFFSLDKLMLLLVLLTPLSFKFEHEQLGFTIDLPVEPIVVAIMLLFFFKLLYERRYDHRVLKHPITIILILNLVWMFVTSVSSELPFVSFKYFISRLWFVVSFFFVGVLLFEKRNNLHLFPWLFAATTVLVVLYITWVHAGFGFERKLGYWVVRPFFNDHTHYSAVLAMIAPFFAIMAFNRSYSILRRRTALIFFIIMCMGILFSYSRASWLSLAIALAGFFILVLRIPFRFILSGLVLLLAGFFVFQTEITMQLERNTQESSGDFSEHLRSITNISSDASNLERINRWKSAYRMFEDRPVLGWGPGTYQLVYAPFQRYEDYTIITTHFGDLGNAHSEYIGPLAESGLPGMILFIALALAVIATGVRLSKMAPDREMRLMALGVTLGFITYFAHGLLNNFLDTDKASVLFWGMMAMLVGMDVYYQKRGSLES